MMWQRGMKMYELSLPHQAYPTPSQFFVQPKTSFLNLPSHFPLWFILIIFEEGTM